MAAVKHQPQTAASVWKNLEEYLALWAEREPSQRVDVRRLHGGILRINWRQHDPTALVQDGKIVKSRLYRVERGYQTPLVTLIED